MGLAIKYPAAKVEAFDIDEKARILCMELAACNNVVDRVKVSGECSPSYLQNLDPDLRRLIICDCEGFERHLFDSSNVPTLKKTDLIIELHPMFEKDVSEYLFDLFNATHVTNIVSSYDDNRKLFDLPEAYKDLNDPERLKLVQEGRSFSMDWLTVVSKS